MTTDVMSLFRLDGRVCVVTGGAGLLGRKHAEAIIEAGGAPVLLDISRASLEATLAHLRKKYGNNTNVSGFVTDITCKGDLEKIAYGLATRYEHVDALINNAANNPKMERNAANMSSTLFEDFSLEQWNRDLAVGLTGAFLCAQVFGRIMVRQKKGVILNISSDLGIIAPDQRIYCKEGAPENEQTFKPVTYSVIKHGLIGLSRYLATWYAEKGVRSNALCPAGVFNDQPAEFVQKLSSLVPMSRMAKADEYKGAIVFMLSDASSYMTGSVVIIDGGRTVW